MSIPYQSRGISPQLLPALFLHYESSLHSAQRTQCRRPRAVTPEPATCALLSAMNAIKMERASQSVVRRRRWLSLLQWLISLFFSSSSTAVVSSQTHSRILFPPVRVCCGRRRTPNAFLSSTRRLRSRTTGTRQARARYDFPWRHSHR